MLEMTRTAAAAALLAVASGGISPLAWSQPSHPSYLMVVVTSPADQSGVSGAVTLSAVTMSVGPAETAGVQFVVDGANLGVEDSAAPYTISWDTTAGRNGARRVTAVARDALGNRYTSAPVTLTVSNAEAGTHGRRFEETDPAVTYAGTWAGDTERPWSAGRAVFSEAGAQARFSFTGTSLAWIGARGPHTGIARVFLDGTLAAEIDTYSEQEEIRAVLFTTTGLPDASHTLVIEATGARNPASGSSAIVVDAFDVTPPPNVASGRTHFEETHPTLSYAGTWAQSTSRPWSGGTAAVSLSGTSGQMSFAFTGTSVRWLGGRGPQTGIARVFLDGAFVGELDTYSPTEEIRVPMFTVAGLADSSHTLTIEATGRRNPAASDTWIPVDGFEVPARAVSRVQETDGAVDYSAGWLGGDTCAAWSGGSAAVSLVPRARASFGFNGTAIRWIGARGPRGGVARVLLDGVLAAEIDLYAATEQIQAEVFAASGLADAHHTLTIEVTGQKNVAAAAAGVVVDAFDVSGRIVDSASR